MANLLRTIGSIARALDSISNSEFQEVALTKGQYLYLVRIYEQPGIIQEKLSEVLKVDRTTTARAIQQLEKKGLIQKVHDTDNKKIKRLFVTKQAQAVYPFILREHEYSTRQALQGISQVEQEVLTELLEKVEKNVSQEWASVKKGYQRVY